MDYHYDGSADVMMIMAGVLVVLLALFIPLAQLEKLTFIENHSRDTQAAVDVPDGRNVALLEVEYAGDGQSPLFHWRADDEADKTILRDYTALLARIEASQPEAIRLRIDRRVDAGVYQDLIIDAANREIPLWQSTQ